ncbi:DUF397 domain-containing protein [Streptomyces sp. 4N509B]|uniref:DUF397 domain-containing protein n=1 Tax=Streptomyces sp. 4N509B TaxID=3457413 RepID=UPI003FD461C8
MTEHPRPTTMAGPPLRWYTSSYSGAQNECVEVAHGLAEAVPVRDSKRPDGPVLLISVTAWSEFIQRVD